MYRVTKFFTDLKDNKYPYNVGDEFPRDGLKVTKKRIQELLSDKNRQGVPLIEEVEETTDEESVKVSDKK